MASDSAGLEMQLIKAAKSGNLLQFKRLLKKGAAIDGKDEMGITALISAAMAGHVAGLKG